MWLKKKSNKRSDKQKNIWIYIEQIKENKWRRNWKREVKQSETYGQTLNKAKRNYDWIRNRTREVKYSETYVQTSNKPKRKYDWIRNWTKKFDK